MTSSLCRLPGTQQFLTFWTKLVATSTCEISIRGYYLLLLWRFELSLSLASSNSVLIPPWFISNIKWSTTSPYAAYISVLFYGTIQCMLVVWDHPQKKTVLYILYHGADLSDLTSAWIWAILLSLKVTTRMTGHMFIAVSGFRFVLKNPSFTFTCHQWRLIQRPHLGFPSRWTAESLRQQKEFPERTQCRTKESQRCPSPEILQSGPLWWFLGLTAVDIYADVWVDCGWDLVKFWKE